MNHTHEVHWNEYNRSGKAVEREEHFNDEGEALEFADTLTDLPYAVIDTQYYDVDGTLLAGGVVQSNGRL